MTVRILLREKEIVMSREHFNTMLRHFDTHDLLDCVDKDIETDEIKIDKSVDCQECTDCMDCTYCSECYGCQNCINCDWCESCDNCVDCGSCTNCHGCNELTNCVGWVDNKPPEVE